ncbi:threonylcarbamoyl-AMP synthase [Bowdeniella nasicola]|uniref:L-threonylcarbamoyladenylate synthase n=1 Tax=Bowdeniella nasicola TaxID=208480 RepID=A0A1Q5Q2Z1_9ACTO|nr:L-threonylcarbamoyladenylate synthase [Bowdeniella nasicola]OKL54208.1 threonylcarbamoyl-AMP synthase [Bowdeniella nasicola]
MIYSCEDETVTPIALDAAAYTLKRSGVIVMPTDTVYGIAADAFDAKAVALLLATKGRGRDMPPPVLVASPAVLDALAAEVPPAARLLADKFWPGPLTLIVPARPSLTWDLGETYGTVALRMPDDDVALQLLNRTGPLAVSSANRSSLPAATTAKEAEEYFGSAVPIYLDAGERRSQIASTIVDTCTTRARIVRAGALSHAQLAEVVPDLEDIEPSPLDAAAEGSED